MKNTHLVILRKPYLDAILACQKTIESRFYRTKRAPFAQISIGDKLFLKVSSGPVCAVAAVSAVKNFENLTPDQIFGLKKRYNQYIRGSDEYWQSRKDSRYGVLVWLKDIRSIEPVQIDKKDWRAWVVLNKAQHFGLV